MWLQCCVLSSCPVLRHRFRTASSVLALVAGLAFSQMSQAADGTVAGAEMSGYGRIIFSLDKAVKAEARTTNGIIILTFAEPVNVALEKLSAQAPNYLSMVRRDPDGKSIRMATTRPMRVNIMEAGEKLFVDILPANWAGLVPSLPTEVVDQLARRARDAEEQLRKANREREKRQVKDMTARVGQGPTFTRLILDAGQTIPVEIKREGDQVAIIFDAALKLPTGELKSQLPETVRAVTSENILGKTTVSISVEPKTEMRVFREDDTVIVDFPKQRQASNDIEAAMPALRLGEKEKPTEQAKSGTASQDQSPVTNPSPQPAAPPPLRSVLDTAKSETLRPQLVRSGEGVQLTIPFSGPVPAAAFMRQDMVWMVFDTREPVDVIAVPPELQNLISRVDVDRTAGATVVRATLAKPDSVSFARSVDGNGWTASIGRALAKPTESIVLKHGATQSGKTALVAKLPSLGQIFWIDDPDTGDRLAVVTSLGPAHSLTKQQNFVEITALQSVHGLAISPRSDDVTITTGFDEVTISRDNGLTVTQGNIERKLVAQDGTKDLLLDVKSWKVAKQGDLRVRINEAQREAAEASKKEQNEKRLKLVKLWLASGYVTEAVGVLKSLEKENSSLINEKPILLLRAIAAIHGNDHKEAARILNDTAVALEGESFLWQGVMHAKNQRWVQSLIGFRQSLDILDRYPEDLQLMIRELVIRAAIQVNDATFASQQVDILEATQGPVGHLQKMALFKGMIAASQERSQEAISNFEIASVTPNREVEVEARLNKVLALIDAGRIDREKGLAELETISMIWRKSEVEIRALDKLGEMYAEDTKWKQAFASARRVSQIMPEHPIARKMHDAMATRFEALFLEGKADQLPKVEAVGLFYDFKNLMPISRRGDEIVRRLADRLADLDLLDQASELLQHQVENRLGGVARARVATRLAVIHLLNRKPAEAAQALRMSRSNDLPEEMRRGRLLLEARALSELSRTDLAMEVIASQSGEDVDRLRADVLWRGKRWRDAGEAIEKVLGNRWEDGNELRDNDRADVMRAGVSYVLAEDRIGLDRLRQKYLAKMAASIDGSAFDIVSTTKQDKPQAFREITRSLVAGSTLSEFLDIYRKRYPEAAGAAGQPNAASDAIKEMKGRQQGQKPAASAPG
jgi:tetratricopeptide (TPR) repeat protein